MRYGYSVPPLPDAVAWYDAHAAAAAARYEGHDAVSLNSWLADLLPKPPAVVMDVGAGSGRDAAWLASLNYDVLAVEPSPSLRAEAIRLHPADSIRWLDERLPDMAGVIRTGLSADAILLSAVWMHVRPADRPRAFRKLVCLLRPGGLLAMRLREGPPEPSRGMHPVSLQEIERLAADQGSPDDLFEIVVYDILFRAASETLPRIAADPKHLGAEIGFLGVLHTWGQNLQHHPHSEYLALSSP
jgi:SAM-dependent methyltransferase